MREPLVRASQLRRVFGGSRAEVTAHGFDLRDFGTSVTVADFEWVRRALGVERWNVYGESYGTTVAMTLVALHPDTVRSAVLDSIYPPDPRPMQSTNVADALDAFFGYCAGDQACCRAHESKACCTWSSTIIAVTPGSAEVGHRGRVRASGNRIRRRSRCCAGWRCGSCEGEARNRSRRVRPEARQLQEGFS